MVLINYQFFSIALYIYKVIAVNFFASFIVSVLCYSWKSDNHTESNTEKKP